MAPAVFSSWKEVAQFFGKSVRTVQRWERTLDLPIIRPEGTAGNIILAKVADLEAWMLRPAAREAALKSTEDSIQTAHSRLEHRERVQRMGALLADLARNTERLRANTSAMNASCMRIKELGKRVERVRRVGRDAQDSLSSEELETTAGAILLLASTSSESAAELDKLSA